MLALAGCQSREPSIKDPSPSEKWAAEQNALLARSLPSAPALTHDYLLAVSMTSDKVAWLQQSEGTVTVFVAPLREARAAHKVTTSDLNEGYFQLALSPDGQNLLLMRQGPDINNPREQAALELWDLRYDEPTPVSDSAAVMFEPTWTSRESFLFAEATSDFNRVLEQRLDGTRTQALALEARYPRLVISALSPQGWVVYDRTRPRDTHLWYRPTSGPGPVWSEINLASQEVRLLGWWRGRAVGLLATGTDATQVMLFQSGKLPDGHAPKGRAKNQDRELARLAGVDFALMRGDRIALLEKQAWGQKLRLLDLANEKITEVATPFAPFSGHKLQPAGSTAAALLLEGPFQPPYAARLDLASARLDEIVPAPDPAGLQPEGFVISASDEGVTLQPRKFDPTLPWLVEAYGGFRRTLPPSFDFVRAEWLRRGGSVRLEQIPAEPEGQEAARDALLKRVAALPAKARVALRGQSMGGTLALMAMQASPTSFDAVWADAPVTDLLHFAEVTPGELWIPEFGDPGNPTRREKLRALSPLANVAAGYPPLMLSTAGDDLAVDTRHATRFVQRLQEVDPKVPVRLLWEKNGTHGHFHPRTEDLWRAVEWMWSRTVDAGKAS